MGHMSKLLDRSLNRSVAYAALVLAAGIPVYYFFLSKLWDYEMAEHNIVLSAEAEREDRFLIIGTVTILTGLFFGLLFAGLVLLNRQTSRRLWKPFYDSLGKIRTFDLSQQKAVRFTPTEIAEFAELNEHLHKLIAGAATAYTQQKEFADNASHELQTPLAIIQSKLDLLLQTEPLSAGQFRIIEDAHKALARAGRINKNLLLLARIDNSQYLDKEMLNISLLTQTAMDIFAPFALSKGITVHSDLTPDISLSGNPELVELLVHNLLKNALQHSLPGTVIRIVLSLQALTISNPGTTPLPEQHLFKRFAGARPDSASTGLGLALARQIADRYRWQLSYQFSNGFHVFSLIF